MNSTNSKLHFDQSVDSEDEIRSGGSFDKDSGGLLYTWAPDKFTVKRTRHKLLSYAVASVMACMLSLFLLMYPSGFEASPFNRFFASMDYKTILVAGFLAGGMVLAVVLHFDAFSNKSRPPSFVDLDERLNSKRLEAQILNLKYQVKQLKVDKSLDGSVDKNGARVEDVKDESYEHSAIEYYISKLTKSLDRHIELSEVKASKLLDTGTLYLRRGIYFYVASIAVWQVVAHIWGVDKQLIFGVISCSLTFLVVEFLAAWFLKQYRSFIDSSVQFMKVKSVFDRYMLSYYAVKEFSTGGAEGLAEAKAQILTVLAEEIKWPETLSSKAGDVNHMVQMFESFASLLDKMKNVTIKNEKS